MPDTAELAPSRAVADVPAVKTLIGGDRCERPRYAIRDMTDERLVIFNL